MTESPQTVHVILAVFDPRPRFLEAQIQSIARQTDVNVKLHAVIADLTSSALVHEFSHACGVSCELYVPKSKLNAVAAFEFGMNAAVSVAGDDDLFSLCDQDDVWNDDKLSKSVEGLRSKLGSQLVHTDARLVDEAGQLLAPSMFAY